MNEPYLSEQLITYIGNKRRLIPWIDSILQTIIRDIGKDDISALDLFSGSGVVSRLLKKYCTTLYVNDLEPYAKVISACYLANADTVMNLYPDTTYYNIIAQIPDRWVSDGFIRRLYAPKDESNITKEDRVFYTVRNAQMLDTCRTIMSDYPDESLPYILAPLLSEASIHTNTSGVFKGFYKDAKTKIGAFGGSGRNALARILKNIELRYPIISPYTSNVNVLQMDAHEAIRHIPHVDIAYLDPPYNQHPYGSNYFMLNLLVDYEEPKKISRVSGIPADWNRSDFNKSSESKEALFSVIKELDANYILISYNNEGFIKYDDIISFLNGLGKLTTYAHDYNTFRGSRNLQDRNVHVKEFLFCLKKH